MVGDHWPNLHDQIREMNDPFCEEDKKENSSSQPASASPSSTPRDEGYCSRTGESFVDEGNSFGDSSTLIDRPAQLREDEGNHENSRHFADGQPNGSKLVKFQNWEGVCKTVEKFSHNTITLLSWIDECEEACKKQTAASPFYGSHAGRRTSILGHIDKVLSQVKRDATLLLQAVPSEKETISTVLNKLESRCSDLGAIDPAFRPTNPSSPLTFQTDSSLLDSESVTSQYESLLKSVSMFRPKFAPTPRTSGKEELPVEGRSRDQRQDPSLEADLGPSTHEVLPRKAKDVTSLSRRSLSLRLNWIEFLRHYKGIRDWLGKMEAVIDRAEKSDLPLTDLQNIFKSYLHQFIDAKPKREILYIKANYIETMFPERREKAERFTDEIDDLWNTLMLRLSNYLSSLLIGDESDRKGGEAKMTSMICSNLSRKQNVSKDSGIASPTQLSDFSFHQIRDRLSLDETSTLDGNRSQNPQCSNARTKTEHESAISSKSPDTSLHGFMHDVEALDQRLSEIEEDSYKEENSVKVGWDPKRLKELLLKNKKQQTKLAEEQVKLDSILRRDVKASDLSSTWSSILLQQRFTNLMMFNLDMECILESRLKIVEKKLIEDVSNEVWMDRGLNMQPSVQANDEK